MENQQKSKSFFKKTGFWIFMVLVGFPMIYGLLFIDEEDIAEAERQEAIQDSIEEAKNQKEYRAVLNSPIDNSVLQVKRYLENTLNDPESYKPVEWSDVQYLEQDNKYMVRHKYRAKNAFGGVITKNEVFFLDNQGNVECQMDYEKAVQYTKSK